MSTNCAQFCEIRTHDYRSAGGGVGGGNRRVLERRPDDGHPAAADGIRPSDFYIIHPFAKWSRISNTNADRRLTRS